MIHEGGSVDKFCQKKIKIKILLSGQTWQQDKQLWFWISCQKTPLCVFATLRSLHPIAWGVKLLDHSFILPNLCFMIVSTQMFPLQLLNSPPLFLSSTPFTPLCFYLFILELHPVPKPQLFYNLDFKHFTISHHNSLFFFLFCLSLCLVFWFQQSFSLHHLTRNPLIQQVSLPLISHMPSFSSELSLNFRASHCHNFP